MADTIHDGLDISQNEFKTTLWLETPQGKRTRLFKQMLMVLGISLGFVNLTYIFGWPNATSSELGTRTTTIFGQDLVLVPSQLDLLGSLVTAGHIPGSCLAGCLSATLGRKKILMYMMIPNVIGWGLVALAIHPSMILVGRFINGIYCGYVLVVGQAYAIELADASIRGNLAVIPTLAMSLGFVICTIFGLFLNWYGTALVAIGMAFLSTFVLYFVPESPTSLVLAGKSKEASEILRRLRGPDANLNEELTCIRSMNEAISKVRFNMLLKPPLAKSVIVILMLFIIQGLSGLSVFLVNATRIFKDAGSSLDEKLSTLLLFVVQFLAGVVACTVMKRLGRKTFLIISLVVNACTLLMMGLYYYLQTTTVLQTYQPVYETSTHYENTKFLNKTLLVEFDRIGFLHDFSWVPMACMIGFLVSSTFGLRPAPYMLCMEYFPTAIRAKVCSFAVIVACFCGYLTLQFYSTMQELLTPGGLYWYYACIAIFGAIFTAIFVKETRGKPIG